MSRLRSAAAVLLVCADAINARAQTNGAERDDAYTRGIVDSAQVARSAGRRAGEALRRRDLPTALREVSRAASAWPSQPAYLMYAASIAARAGDSSAARQWLTRYAALGIGARVRDDSAFDALRATSWFRELAAGLEREASLTRSRTAFTIADSTLHPEGLAYDARSRRWFVSSVREPRIVGVEPDGASSTFTRAVPATPLGGLFGMAVDTTRGLLWVATSWLSRTAGYSAADRGRAGVVAFELASGRAVRSGFLPRDSAEHVVGDVALGAEGQVYATDSQTGGLFVLAAGADSLRPVATHPILRSPQGMVVEAGNTVLVADYSHGLVRVDVSSGAVRALEVADGITTVGIDGLYADRGTLVATQNGVSPARLVRFCLDAARRRVVGFEVLDRSPAVADEMTLGTVVGDHAYYVATGSWEKYDDAGQRIAGTTLRPVMVLEVPLGAATCSSPAR